MDAAILLGLGLIAVAVLLIIVEAFLPSGGIIGIIALAAAAGGVVMLFREDTTWGFIGLLVTIVLMPAAFFYALTVLPDTPFGRRLIGVPDEEQVFAEQQRERALRDERAALVGLEGTAVTALRPVGTVLVAGERMEAVSELGLIEPGQPIRVTAADPRIVKVRPVV